MQLTLESLKWPQIDAAFKYIYDNRYKYYYRTRRDIALTDVYEFGTRHGHSLRKITEYVKSNDLVGIPIYVHGFDSFEGLPKEAYHVDVFSKFAEGSYSTDLTPKKIKESNGYDLLSVHKCWFNELNKTHAGKPALLVHIDCDLYTSTLDALNFLDKNDLLQNNTLIAYDEFESTSDPKSGGERRAHEEFFGSLKGCFTDEVWMSIYYDKSTGQRIKQSVWEVLT